MKTTNELLTGKKSRWAIVNEKGEVLEEFRGKCTAQQWIPKMKMNKREKLEVIELT